MGTIWSSCIVVLSILASGCGSAPLVDRQANESNSADTPVPTEPLKPEKQSASLDAAVNPTNLAGSWWGEAEDGTRFWRRFHEEGAMGFGGFWSMGCYEIKGSQVLFHASPCQKDGRPWSEGKAFAVLEIKRLIVATLRATPGTCAAKEAALKEGASAIAQPISRMRSLYLHLHYRSYLTQYFGPGLKSWLEELSKLQGGCAGLLQRALPAANAVLDDSADFRCPGDTRQAWLA